jgi:hypothetical protein
MANMSKYQFDRLAEKLIRMAYELEHDASRVRADSCKPSYAEAIKNISSRLGDLGRSMIAEITC